MASVKDDRGYNQGFEEKESTLIRLERRCDWMIKEMDLSSPKNILEIGCGTGRLSYMMAQKTSHQVLGTDLCVPFIEEANQNFKLPNLQYSYLDFNFPESLQGKKFDYIIGNGILHHLYYHLDEALVKIKDLLADGGKMIFMEPNIYNPYCTLIFKVPFFRKLAHLEPDEMAFSKSFISKKLQKAGYSNRKAINKDFLLPGIPEVLIKPTILFSNIADEIPIVKEVSQSIFIVGERS